MDEGISHKVKLMEQMGSKDRITHINSFYYDILQVSSLSAQGFDGIIYVSNGLSEDMIHPQIIKNVLLNASHVDEGFDKSPGIYNIDLPSRRLIYSPTGTLDADYDTVKTFAVAAKQGVERAIQAGAKCPLLVLLKHKKYQKCQLVTLLGAMEGLYQDYTIRESSGNTGCVTKLGLWGNEGNTNKVIQAGIKIELGRSAARDIAQMSAQKAEEYIKLLFPLASNVKICISCETGPKTELTSSEDGTGVMLLKYEVEYPETTLYLVGRSNSTDDRVDESSDFTPHRSYGFGTIIGLMKIFSLFKPNNISVIAAVAMSPPVFTGEAFKTQSGRQICVNPSLFWTETILAHALSRVKNMALISHNPYILTISSELQLHSGVPGYTLVVENGVSRTSNFSMDLQSKGEDIGDLLEISSLRKTDFPLSSVSSLSHQPMTFAVTSSREREARVAFIMMVSGLDACGSDSKKPIPYCHLDVGWSCGEGTSCPTGAPILALTNKFLPLKLYETT